MRGGGSEGRLSWQGNGKWDGSLSRCAGADLRGISEGRSEMPVGQLAMARKELDWQIYPGGKRQLGLRSRK